MPLPRLVIAALAGTAALATAPGALAAPVLDAPGAARIGTALTIKASGGLTPRLYYRATFIESADHRVRGRQCGRNIGTGFRTGTSLSRVYVFEGRVPQRLACVQGQRRFTVPVHAWLYTVVVGHKIGKAAWDSHAVALRQHVQVPG